jgi:hypothetical protein
VKPVSALLMLGIKKLFASCPEHGAAETVLITSFHDHLVSKKLIASSQSCGRTPLDSTLLLCFVQSRLHLPLTAHCQFYVRRQTSIPPSPKILIVKMVTTVLAETFENLQA